MLLLIIGPYVLALAWIIVFWFASLTVYLINWLLSLLGINMDISGDKNVWMLFMLVISVSCWVYSLDGSNFGFALFVFLSGAFTLFKSADTWRIASCQPSV